MSQYYKALILNKVLSHASCHLFSLLGKSPNCQHPTSEPLLSALAPPWQLQARPLSNTSEPLFLDQDFPCVLLITWLLPVPPTLAIPQGSSRKAGVSVTFCNFIFNS